MDQKLQRWIKLTREAKCPSEVMEAVTRRRSGKDDLPQATRAGWGESVWIGVAAILMTALILAQWQPGTHPSQELAQQVRTLTDAEIQAVRDMQVSLTMIGNAFVIAGQKTTLALVEDAQGPLSRSFQTVQELLTNLQSNHE